MADPGLSLVSPSGGGVPIKSRVGPLLDLLLREQPDHLAVAVSGGVDSLALAWLANAWRRESRCQLTVLTVDHGLRPSSDHEARQVAAWMARWGLPHHILRWDGEKPPTGIQDAARQARYKLLTDWCWENDAGALLVAHTLEDQAETFLMRLLRGSGGDGLAAMRAVSRINGLPLIRPLLGVEKRELMGVLRDVGQDWIEDPSNQDDQFARVRVRRWSSTLAGLGLDAGRIGRLAANFGTLRTSLEDVTRDAVSDLVNFDSGGWAELPQGLLCRAPDILARRILLSVLRSVGGKYHAPRSDRVTRGLAKCRVTSAFQAFSLGGCIVRQKGHSLIIYREERGKAPPTELPSADRFVWRGRFMCEFQGKMDKDKTPYSVGPLLDQGWRKAIVWDPTVRRLGICHDCAATLPALYDVDGLLEVPRLGLRRPDLLSGTPTEYPDRFRFKSVRFMKCFAPIELRKSL